MVNVLGFLLNLILGLFTITIGVYAVSVSLLGAQLKRNKIFVQRRVSETENEIENIKKSKSDSLDRLSSIDVRIQELKSELKELNERSFCLELNGAVIYPCSLFIIALSIIILNSYLSLIDEIYVVFFSTIFIGGGIYRLYCTLASINFAATNIPMSDFKVRFSNFTNQLILEPNKEYAISIDLENDGSEVAELIEFSIFFPPEFLIKEADDEEEGEDEYLFYEVTIQPIIDEIDYPGYKSVTFEFEYLHIDAYYSNEIIITTPNIEDKYKIPIMIAEKEITQRDKELTIIVKKE